MASNVVPVELVDGGTDDVAIATTTTSLFGWSLHESATTAAVATVTIRRGSGTGAVVAQVEFAANGSDSQWFGPQGVRCQDGIFVDRDGEAGGSVFIG